MDLKRFVQDVKARCERRNVKPTVACREAGVGDNFISNINNGSVPSVEKVQMLAKYFGISTSELLGETGSATKTALSYAEIELLEAYWRADEHTRKVVNVALAPYKKAETTSHGAG